mgnify:CR=1 FL=1
MTINDYRSWLTEDLQSLLSDLKFQKDRAETFSDRADLNLEIQRVKKELSIRKNEAVHTE